MDIRGIFKAIVKGTTKWVEGYLFQLAPPIRCFAQDPEQPPTWYIVTSQSTDWGLPCIPKFHEVDPDTICECIGVLSNGKKIFEGDRWGDIGTLKVDKAKPYVRWDMRHPDKYLSDIIMFDGDAYAAKKIHSNIHDKKGDGK